MEIGKLRLLLIIHILRLNSQFAILFLQNAENLS